MQIEKGIQQSEREHVAALYWQGFGEKLGRMLGPQERAVAYIACALNSDHIFCARTAAGSIAGIAGYQTPKGGLLRGNPEYLVVHYGHIGAIWRRIMFSLLKSPFGTGSFVIDGIVVAREYRGNGIGTDLIEALAREANRQGYDMLRLEVVDDNFRAKALYERRGFRKSGGASIGILRHIFGFRRTITMERRLR